MSGPGRVIFFVLLLFAGSALEAQLKVVKPVNKQNFKVSKLGIGLGRSRSVLFLMRNIKSDNDARGWNLSAVYGLTRIVRVNAEYSWYKPINIAPTWYDVKAYNVEVNVNFLSALAETKAKFYPLVGLSYNVFDGYFTGAYDHLNLQSLYRPNSQVRTKWLGLNAGCGFEHFVKFVSVFGEFKMRVGVSEGYNQVTIMDVCLSAGMRFNIPVPSPSALFDGTRSRYLLRTSD